MASRDGEMSGSSRDSLDARLSEAVKDQADGRLFAGLTFDERLRQGVLARVRAEEATAAPLPAAPTPLRQRGRGPWLLVATSAMAAGLALVVWVYNTSGGGRPAPMAAITVKDLPADSRGADDSGAASMGAGATEEKAVTQFAMPQHAAAPAAREPMKEARIAANSASDPIARREADKSEAPGMAAAVAPPTFPTIVAGKISVLVMDAQINASTTIVHFEVAGASSVQKVNMVLVGAGGQAQQPVNVILPPGGIRGDAVFGPVDPGTKSLRLRLVDLEAKADGRRLAVQLGGEVEVPLPFRHP